MSTTTDYLLALWGEARTRFSQQLALLTEEDLGRRLPPSPNSVGFLVRHIGDVEFLFAKNVFGAADVHVVAKTVIAQRDTGEWTDLAALRAYVEASAAALQAIVAAQTEADWAVVIHTKEFGSKTKAEAFGRIVSHTAYHAGQLALLRKYGSVQEGRD
jgi:uncharacterized damage-inducible protein DinB